MQQEAWGREVVRRILRLERDGLPLSDALRTIISDPAAGWLARGETPRVLALSNAQLVARQLLSQFFSQEEKDELWETARTVERFGDVRCVGPLVNGLSDINLYRRQAVARALGWIPNSGTRAVNALIKALTDVSQPVAVREEAAESLAYLNSSRAIGPLISVLAEPDVRIRFWAVFALGASAIVTPTGAWLLRSKQCWLTMRFLRATGGP
jgi:HEAT repeat protein